MSLEMNAFEGKLKEAMDHYELPFEPSRWKEMERCLNHAHFKDYSRWVAGAATALIISAGSYLYLYKHSASPAMAGYDVERYENFEPVSAIKTVYSADRQGLSVNLNGLEIISENNSNAGHYTDQAVVVNGILPESLLVADLKSGNPELSKSKPSETKGDRGSVLAIESSDRHACAGREIDFAVKNGPSGGSYLWNFGDGNFSNQPRPSHRYDKSGVFDVSLSVTDQSGRINTNVMNGMVTINPAPEADFEWDFINRAGDAPTVKLVNTSQHANRSEWQFADGSASELLHPIKELPESGKFMIALEVSNEWGCVDSKVKYVHVNSDYQLLAPATFTPGKELFMPEALRQGKMNFKLTVYDEQKPVFETSSKNKGWDGKLPDGSVATGKSYDWVVIVFNETTKEEKYFNGSVSVNP